MVRFHSVMRNKPLTMSAAPAMARKTRAGARVGAMVANVASGWVGAVRRYGLAIAISSGVWGLAIVAFGLAPTLAPALAFLAIAGAADMVSGLFRMTLWNQTIPDHLRGRLAGIEMVSYTSGPTLGNVEAGGVATRAGVHASIVSGGVLCVIGAGLLTWALPAFRRYRAEPPSAASPAAAGSEGSTPP